MGGRRTNPDSETNIKRIDHSRKGKETHGFQVHFSRDAVNYTRFYSDKKYGGKEIALELARNFREILRNRIPRSKANDACHSGPAHSNSGIMGISISERFRADGSSYLYLQVSVRVAPKKSVNRRIPILDGGLDQAINEAEMWRAAMLRERQASEGAI